MLTPFEKREKIKEKRINAMIKDCRVYRDGKWVLIDWDTDEIIPEEKNIPIKTIKWDF